MKPIFEKINVVDGVDGFESTTTHIRFRYLGFFIDMNQGELHTGFVTYPVYFADGISCINGHTYRFAKPTDASFEEFSESFKRFIHDTLNIMKKDALKEKESKDLHVSSEDIDISDLVKKLSEQMILDISHFKGSKSWDSYDKLLNTSKALTPISDWINTCAYTNSTSSSTSYTNYLNSGGNYEEGTKVYVSNFCRNRQNY